MVGHKLGEFAFTKKRFKYKYALFRRFHSWVEEAHRFSQTYEEQVIELSTLILSLTPWQIRGIYNTYRVAWRDIATGDEGSSSAARVAITWLYDQPGYS